jgi:hypothetical protein
VTLPCFNFRRRDLKWSFLHVRLSEQFPQFSFGPLQLRFLLGAQFFPTSIDVEVEHGHRRLEWRAFPAPAAESRAFERSGNLPRIRLGEDALLQVQRITALHDISRPFAAFLWTRYLGFLSHRNLHSYRLWPGRVINSSSSTGFLQSMKTPLMRRHRWP